MRKPCSSFTSANILATFNFSRHTRFRGWTIYEPVTARPYYETPNSRLPNALSDSTFAHHSKEYFERAIFSPRPRSSLEYRSTGSPITKQRPWGAPVVGANPVGTCIRRGDLPRWSLLEGNLRDPDYTPPPLFR